MFKLVKWAYEQGKANERQRVRLVLESARQEYWNSVERFNRLDMQERTKHEKNRVELNAAITDILRNVLEPKPVEVHGVSPLDES